MLRCIFCALLGASLACLSLSCGTPPPPVPKVIVGPKGDTGTAGSNGIDITPITVVQLCPGISVYPSKFIELAFCIDHKLYAVYSANGGFLTEILPGAWSSNAINSICDFTVLADCVVVN